MSENLEHSFVAQLKENQNIIHKICRLYKLRGFTQRLVSGGHHSIMEGLSKFRGDSKFSTWAYRVALNTAITLYRKNKRSIATVEYEGRQHFIKDITIMKRRSKLNLCIKPFTN
jgi:RNA polymerase sigma-70 factor (ECF subfamily)